MTLSPTTTLPDGTNLLISQLLLPLRLSLGSQTLQVPQIIFLVSREYIASRFRACTFRHWCLFHDRGGGFVIFDVDDDGAAAACFAAYGGDRDGWRDCDFGFVWGSGDGAFVFGILCVQNELEISLREHI